jgi:Tfp pilus assembly PilM family ATPase
MSLLPFLKKILPKPPRRIGLMLDHAGLQLLELEKVGKNYVLHHYSQTLFPAKNRGEHFSFAHPLCIDFLKQTLQKYHLTSRKVALGLSHASALFKTIFLDKNLTEREIALQVRTHAEAYFNYPLSELRMDFEPLGISKENPGLREVRWVAVRRVEVEKALEVLDAVGLSVTSVGIDSYALCSVANYYMQKQQRSPTHLVVLHLHDSYLLFAAIEKEICTYMRTEKYEIPLPLDSISLHASEVFSAIVQSMQLFLAHGKERPVTCILLSGKYVSDALIEKVQDRFHVSTTRLDVFAHLCSPEPTLSPSSPESPLFSIQVGLAMQAFAWE